jgi:hypothetical protein
MFQKELCSDIGNVIVWRVLLKRLHLKACKVSTVLHLGVLILTEMSTMNLSGSKGQATRKDGSPTAIY